MRMFLVIQCTCVCTLIVTCVVQIDCVTTNILTDEYSNPMLTTTTDTYDESYTNDTVMISTVTIGRDDYEDQYFDSEEDEEKKINWETIALSSIFGIIFFLLLTGPGMAIGIIKLRTKLRERAETRRNGMWETENSNTGTPQPSEPDTHRASSEPVAPVPRSTFSRNTANTSPTSGRHAQVIQGVIDVLRADQENDEPQRPVRNAPAPSTNHLDITGILSGSSAHNHDGSYSNSDMSSQNESYDGHATVSGRDDSEHASSGDTREEDGRNQVLMFIMNIINPRIDVHNSEDVAHTSTSRTSNSSHYITPPSDTTGAPPKYSDVFSITNENMSNISGRDNVNDELPSYDDFLKQAQYNDVSDV